MYQLLLYCFCSVQHINNVELTLEEHYPSIPPETYPVRLCSVTAPLIGITLVYVLTFTVSAAYLQISRTSIFGRCSNSAQFSTKQTGSHTPKQQHNIRILFKIKHSLLTQAQKSTKRDKYKLYFSGASSFEGCNFCGLWRRLHWRDLQRPRQL